MQKEKQGLSDNAFTNHKLQASGIPIVSTESVKAKEFIKEKK